MSKRLRRLRERRRRHHSVAPTKRQIAAGAGLTIGATLAGAGSAQATDYTVTNLNDSGPGSLRQAVGDSNANPGADRVLFQSGLSGTISLTGGLLFVNDATQILGPGANQITVALDPGNNDYSVFTVYKLPLGSFVDVTISGLTVTGADYTSSGGGIRSSENLTVSDAVITGNSAVTGGGIAARGGALNLTSSTISGNSADDYGGAIYARYADATIQSSTLSGNSVGEDGGAIYASYGGQLLAIQNSTIANNTVTAPDGDTGAVFFCCGETGDRLTIGSSTVSGNSTAGHGGGVYVFDSTPGSNPSTLSNTIVAGNSAVSGAPDVQTLGTYAAIGAAFSLIGSTSGATINTTVPGSNLTGVDPQLGPLASNGGPTQTMALASTSPAVDKGSAFGLTSDQRGVQRPIDFPGIANATGGDGSDIGAFELQPSNAFKLGRLKKNKRKGTAKLKVRLPLPDAGKLTLFGKGLKRKSKKVAGKAKVKLGVVPKGKKERKLADNGKVKVKIKVKYSPTGNSAVTKKRKAKLVKKQARR
jgi:predicted outer membrane repeat protein